MQLPVSLPRLKRLYIVNHSLCIGGVERKIADIARYLAAQHATDVRVGLLLETELPAASPENSLSARVRQTSAQIHFKPATPFLPFFFYLFWQILWRSPDVVLAFSRRPAVFTLAIRQVLWWRKLRVVLGIDTLASHALEAYTRKRMLRRVFTWQAQWLYPRAALILVPSDTSKQDLIQTFRVPSAKIRVLKNWTEDPAPQNAAKRYDLIYVGRVDPLKQLTRWIEIIHTARAQRPSLRALLVGDGADMPNVLARTRALQLETVVEFVGFQSDVAPYLAQAKLFCLTSKFEGLPLAALEAMAHGLPVLTLAYPGAAELVQNGETGFICRDAQEFCATALRVLDDDALRAQLGANAQACIRREHGASVLTQYVESVLRA